MAKIKTNGSSTPKPKPSQNGKGSLSESYTNGTGPRGKNG